MPQRLPPLTQCALLHAWIKCVICVIVVAATVAFARSPFKPITAVDVHAASYTLDLLPARRAATDTSTVLTGTTPSKMVSPTERTVQEQEASEQTPDVFVVIGVKSRAWRGAAARQAIRETWADRSAAERLGARVLFLGCEPDLSPLGATERIAAEDAIAAEKARHSDLLTDELQCQDSFFTLVDKTVAFMAHAHATFPTLSYAMVTDDDVYVRLDRLVGLLRSERVPSQRFYGGNAGDMKLMRPSAPIRNPESRYYLPAEVYPVAELPPFLAGSHYVVSSDIVRFVARNRRDLRGLRGLDDATMALWLLTLQVHPIYIPAFQIVRSWNCTEDLISYADLSPLAILQAHANLLVDRGFCAGFDPEEWFREYRTVTFADFADDSDAADNGDVKFDWNLELDPASSRLRILIKITINKESVELLYFPASATFSIAYCNRMLPLLDAKLSILVGTNFCRKTRNLLLEFILAHDTSQPALRPLLAVVRHNLEQHAVNDAADRKGDLVVVAVVSAQSRAVYVVIECLMVAAFPNKQIVVVDERGSKSDQLPDIVVAVVNRTATAIQSITESYAALSPKLILMSSDGYPIPTVATGDQRVVTISSDSTSLHPRHIYIPQASLVFAGAIRHSPMDLLHPAAAADPRSRSFCVAAYDTCDTPRMDSFVQLLGQEEAVERLGACVDSTPARNPSPSAAVLSLTPIDDDIDSYKRYKFAITFEKRTIAGLLSEQLAMAFAAGSVPIFYGDSATANRVFNPLAFIDCGRLASLAECAARVLEVHRSPSLYQAMLQQPPVVDHRAFAEAFAWHPQVAEFAASLGGVELLGDRLRALLE